MRTRTITYPTRGSGWKRKRTTVKGWEDIPGIETRREERVKRRRILDKASMLVLKNTTIEEILDVQKENVQAKKPRDS